MKVFERAEAVVKAKSALAVVNEALMRFNNGAEPCRVIKESETASTIWKEVQAALGVNLMSGDLTKIVSIEVMRMLNLKRDVHTKTLIELGALSHGGEWL